MAGGILGILPQAAGGGGILDNFSNFAADNRASLLGLGAGLLSGQGWGAGAQGYMQGMQQDQRTRLLQQAQAEKLQKQQALKDAATKLGVDPNLAAASLETFAAVAANKLIPKEPSFQERLYNSLPTDQQTTARDALLGLNKNPNLTDDVKEYQIARQQGYTGSFLDYQKEVKRAGAQNITLNQRSESEAEKLRAQSATKYLGGLADEGPKVAQRSADLDFLGRVLARTPTGPGADMRAWVDGIGSYAGLSPGTLKTQAEAIKAVTNRIAPTLRPPGSGSQSDAELAGFLSALPQVAATPGGNQLIQSTLQRAATIDRERTKIAAQWRAGKKTYSQAIEEIAALDNASIFASDDERKIIENIMGGQPLSGSQKTQGNWRILGVE